jgi:hypothetical protein
VYEDPVPAVRLIIVRLWWEQTGADDVVMRARVISTVNDTPTSTSAAATIDGIVDAVRAAVGLFLAYRPVGTGGARRPRRKPRQTKAAKANSGD